MSHSPTLPVLWLPRLVGRCGRGNSDSSAPSTGLSGEDLWLKGSEEGRSLGPHSPLCVCVFPPQDCTFFNKKDILK